jgi:uncharacterized membrane protein
MGATSTHGEEMSAGALFLAVFLACAVEAVEATTIVLAAGLARGWRSAAYGMVAAIGLLVVVVAALGVGLNAIPPSLLRLVIGTLLLVFGLQWLRTAVLRAAGVTSVHDENEIFHSELETARQAPAHRRGAVPDWYGFTLSFQGVLLEGTEVAFIVLTFGSNQHALPLAAVAAGCAILVVGAAGLAVRAPLARVPENALKFIVGTMLTAFGTFWATEGAGARWPGSDAALLVLVPAVAVFGLLLAAGLHRQIQASGRRASGLASAGNGDGR